jgi:hypothetical protein
LLLIEEIWRWDYPLVVRSLRDGGLSAEVRKKVRGVALEETLAFLGRIYVGFPLAT